MNFNQIIPKYTNNLLDLLGSSGQPDVWLRWTPLHYASQFGYLKIVQMLLDAKADAAPKDLSCSPPLALATMENQAGTSNKHSLSGATSRMPHDILHVLYF